MTLVDTGDDTMTGGRLKRVREYLEVEQFCLTDGDGLCDVNIVDLLEHHRSSGKLATVTAVEPPGRFGALVLKGESVTGFREKPEDGGWINGGYFVLSPQVIDLVDGDRTVWEREPMETLTKNGQLNAFLHYGFFQPMDTLREKIQLEEMWQSGNAPWKIW